MLFPSLPHSVARLQTLALTVVPHGGQASARRNAWAAMAADATQARARREAELVMDRAVARASHPALASR